MERTNKLINIIWRVAAYIYDLISAIVKLICRVISYYEKITKEDEIEESKVVSILLSQEKISEHEGDKLDLIKLEYDCNNGEDNDGVMLITMGMIPNNDEMRKIRSLRINILTFVNNTEDEWTLSRNNIKEIQSKFKKQIMDILQQSGLDKKRLQNFYRNVNVKIREIRMNKFKRVGIVIVKISEDDYNNKRAPIYALNKHIIEVIEKNDRRAIKAIVNRKHPRVNTLTGLVNNMNVRMISDLNKIYSISMINYVVMSALTLLSKSNRDDVVIITIELENNGLLAKAVNDAIELYSIKQATKKQIVKLGVLNKYTAVDMVG